MTEPELLAEIEAEAERIRHDGSLPPGFEASVAATFATLAADPAALEREARGADGPPLARAGGAVKQRARRLVGPPLRTLQRKSLERLVLVRDATAARRLAAAEQAGPMRGRLGAAARRAVGAPGRPVAGPLPPALVSDETGRLGDAGLEAFIFSSLSELPAGPVLVLEGGQEFIGRRLATKLAVSPKGHLGGIFAPLLDCPASSLGGILLSGRSAGGWQARLLARLVAARLVPGGSVVVVSDEPSWRASNDPVTADLVSTGPVNSGTWLYLLAAAGLEAGRVETAGDATAYAVSARRPL